MADFVVQGPSAKNGRQPAAGYLPQMHLYKNELPGKGIKKKPVSRKREQRSGDMRKIFAAVVVFLFLVLIAEVLFHTVIGPRLMIQRIEVRVANNLELSKREILRLAGVEQESYYFNLDTEKIAASLEGYPLIKAASVRKSFPDTLILDISGRTPLAYSLVDTEAGAVPVAFDEEGVIFQIGMSVEEAEGLVISGVKFNDLALGMRLPEELAGFLLQLDKLEESSPFLFSMISEIKLIRKKGSDFEALMYTTDFAVPVRIGSSIDAQLMKYILMVLDVVTQKEFAESIEEVDFRTGEIVYTMKEG